MQLVHRSLLVLILAFMPLSAQSGVDKTSFYYPFHNAQFVDQHGKPFSSAMLEDKMVLFHFIFTQCSNVCPVQIKALNKVKQSLSPALKAKVHFVSVSLDPMHDTPTVLTAFAKRMHIETNAWTFLTGDFDSTQALISRLRLFGHPEQAKNAKKPNDHSTNIWLIDPKGRLMQRYSGSPLDVSRVSKELLQLDSLYQ
jgi:cytochrome oxidase Cu insertion factor (SCO1/SenC/PrrC family)